MHSQNNNGRLKEILKLIDGGLSSWVSHNDWPIEGLRPFKNYSLDSDELEDEIIACQHGYGKRFVRIGTAFDWHKLKPMSKSNHICLYLGDVDRIVNEFKKSLEEYEDGRGKFS